MWSKDSKGTFISLNVVLLWSSDIVNVGIGQSSDDNVNITGYSIVLQCLQTTLMYVLMIVILYVAMLGITFLTLFLNLLPAIVLQYKTFVLTK